ncbi:hypothetical protein TNCV_6941 [Trichonephila clavipes]|nr:hypothetical protein TNCV_6941 [Trichonephila clavipes]
MTTRVHTSPKHTNGTGQVQMGDVGPSALQFGHVTLRFPCVWSTEETPEREAIQLGRRIQGHCEGLVSSQPQEFWEQGILWLVHQWDRCAQAYGVYFE